MVSFKSLHRSLGEAVKNTGAGYGRSKNTGAGYNALERKERKESRNFTGKAFLEVRGRVGCTTVDGKGKSRDLWWRCVPTGNSRPTFKMCT